MARALNRKTPPTKILRMVIVPSILLRGNKSDNSPQQIIITIKARWSTNAQSPTLSQTSSRSVSNMQEL